MAAASAPIAMKEALTVRFLLPFFLIFVFAWLSVAWFRDWGVRLSWKRERLGFRGVLDSFRFWILIIRIQFIE